MLKPNNKTVTEKQFVAVAQKIKECKLTDNAVRKAAVAVLERLRKNLKETFEINGFDTKQEINDSVLDEILKEPSPVPQPQSEVPDGEIHNESTTENGDQPEVPENSEPKEVKNSEIDDDSLSEVHGETSEAEELAETEDEDDLSIDDASDENGLTENEEILSNVDEKHPLPPVAPAEPVVPVVSETEPSVEPVAQTATE